MIDMKRLFSILPTLVLAFNLLNAADLRTIFINMPDSVMPLFTKSERMDFFDYMDSGMEAKAVNKLGGESVMTLFRDDMLSINTSESGSADIVLFKRKDGTSLVCMIVTVLGNYPDSRLSFYNEDWTPIPANSLIKYPSMEDYLTKKALKNDSLPELQRQSMLRLQSVSAVDGVLEFNYTSLGYIGEDAEYFRDWFKDEPIRFFWNGKRFKK